MFIFPMSKETMSLSRGAVLRFIIVTYKNAPILITREEKSANLQMRTILLLLSEYNYKKYDGRNDNR